MLEYCRARLRAAHRQDVIALVFDLVHPAATTTGSVSFPDSSPHFAVAGQSPGGGPAAPDLSPGPVPTPGLRSFGPFFPDRSNTADVHAPIGELLVNKGEDTQYVAEPCLHVHLKQQLAVRHTVP